MNRNLWHKYARCRVVDLHLIRYTLENEARINVKPHNKTIDTHDGGATKDSRPLAEATSARGVGIAKLCSAIEIRLAWVVLRLLTSYVGQILGDIFIRHGSDSRIEVSEGNSGRYCDWIHVAAVQGGCKKGASWVSVIVSVVWF